MNFRHDVALTMATSIAVIVACLFTWAVCHWWYGRKLQAAAHRLHKSDKERAFSREQTLQARRQVEQLKTELKSHQRSASANEAAAAARQRAVRLEEERQAAVQASDSSFMPIVAAHGFAELPAELVAQHAAVQRMRFRPSRPLDERLLTDLPAVTELAHAGDQLLLTGTAELVAAVTATLARHGVVAEQLRVEQPSLDDAFVALTGGAA